MFNVDFPLECSYHPQKECYLIIYRRRKVILLDKMTTYSLLNHAGVSKILCSSIEKISNNASLCHPQANLFIRHLCTSNLVLGHQHLENTDQLFLYFPS